jgi:kumamolisin
MVSNLSLFRKIAKQAMIEVPHANPVPMPSLNPIPPTVAAQLPFTGYGPPDIEAAYDYPQVGLKSGNTTGTGATIAIEGAYGYSPADLDVYLAHYNITRTASVLMETPDGPSPFNPYESIETDADVEQASAQAPGATVEMYEAPLPLDTMIEDMYDGVVNDPNVDVVTTSFGSCETDDSAEEMGATDDLFTQGSAEGQTMFAAAGDDGAQDCRATEPTNSVDYPSSSPEVGSAGGTTMVDTMSGGPIKSETGWSCETSDTSCSNGAGGGGISAVFSLPPWQRGLPGAKSQQFFNRPDVSLNADVNTAYALVLDGQALLSVGGTSLVAPNLAALYADIDGYYGHRMGRAAATIYRPFLTGTNPYGASGPFHDLTAGDNTDLEYEVAHAGYLAGPGYDNDNGWGSVNGTNLLLSIPKPTGSNNL